MCLGKLEEEKKNIWENVTDGGQKELAVKGDRSIVSFDVCPLPRQHNITSENMANIFLRTNMNIHLAAILPRPKFIHRIHETTISIFLAMRALTFTIQIHII